MMKIAYFVSSWCQQSFEEVLYTGFLLKVC